jgi:hypothetical protein
VITLARWRGFSPFEIFSPRADRAFIGMLRRKPAPEAARSGEKPEA